ncbi:hypothetical protein FB451DRAFT_1227742, partial [Mycena latifolia]
MTLFFTSVLIGDSLIIYRLWIIWERNRYIVIFPIISLVGMLAGSFGILYKVTQWEPSLRGAPFHEEIKPWMATSFSLSLLTTIYSTTFIVLRITRATVKAKSASESRLMSFLAILVESAALQMFWLTFTAITMFATSDAEFIASDTLPAIIGISNLLIHARVGLGWSPDSTPQYKVQPTRKLNTEDAV